MQIFTLLRVGCFSQPMASGSGQKRSKAVGTENFVRLNRRLLDSKILSSNSLVLRISSFVKLCYKIENINVKWIINFALEYALGWGSISLHLIESRTAQNWLA